MAAPQLLMLRELLVSKSVGQYNDSDKIRQRHVAMRVHQRIKRCAAP